MSVSYFVHKTSYKVVHYVNSMSKCLLRCSTAVARAEGTVGRQYGENDFSFPHRLEK